MGVEAVEFDPATITRHDVCASDRASLSIVAAMVISFVLLAFLMIACATVAFAVGIVATPLIGCVYLIIFVFKSGSVVTP